MERPVSPRKDENVESPGYVLVTCSFTLYIPSLYVMYTGNRTATNHYDAECQITQIPPLSLSSILSAIHI